MTSESLTWKLEQDMCRCCHSEGSFPSLSDPCNYLGQQEIYSDMLSDCFDVHISPVPGPLCTVTYTICQACVMQLRAACNFKKQVLYCEERFQEMYSKNFINVSDCNPAIKVEVEEIFKDDCSDEYVDSLACASDEHTAYTMTNDNDDRSKRKKVKPRSKRTKVQKTICKTKKKKQLSPPRDDASAPAQAAVTKKKVMSQYTPKKKDSLYYTIEDDGAGGKNYICLTCNKVYKTKTCVAQHYKFVHLKQRPKSRTCYLCGVKVAAHLKAAHREKEHGIPAPSCGACGKKFAFPFQVLQHQKRDHMGERMFSCDICQMKFKHKKHLETHVMKHSSLRPHKCQFCDKAFKWKSNLTTHVMMHLDDRRHVCSVCGAAFVQRSSLTYHLTRKHPDFQ